MNDLELAFKVLAPPQKFCPCLGSFEISHRFYQYLEYHRTNTVWSGHSNSKKLNLCKFVRGNPMQRLWSSWNLFVLPSNASSSTWGSRLLQMEASLHLRQNWAARQSERRQTRPSVLWSCYTLTGHTHQHLILLSNAQVLWYRVTFSPLCWGAHSIYAAISEPNMHSNDTLSIWVLIIHTKVYPQF